MNMKEDKYLPIGTICSIQGNNSLVMINGYLSLKYYDKVKLFDYQGVSYPQGGLKNEYISFNHDEIVDIKYLGYKNDEYFSLTHQLNSQTVKEIFNSKDSLFENIQFDENGVVEFATMKNYNNKHDSISLKEENTNIINPFVTDINQRKEKNIEDAKDWPIFKDIQFDENGVVISASYIDNNNNKE